MTKDNNKEEKPKGKVYQTFDLCGEKVVRDSAWAANQYQAGFGLIAEAVNKVREAREMFALAQSATEDNGDPEMDADQAMIKLAECLGSAWQYYKEYLEEVEAAANKPTEDD